MSEKIKNRLFIALNLPEETREAITGTVKRILSDVEDVKWQNGDNCHLTLHFIGETDFDTENRIKRSLQSLDNKFPSLIFRTGGIGAFPNLTLPRIIFLECKQVNGNSILKLQETIGMKLIGLGINIDRRAWKPHITIGRVKEGKRIKMPTESIQPDQLEFRISSFELMKSDLKPSGPVYTTLASYKLN